MGDWVFDQPHYEQINAARDPLVRQLAPEIVPLAHTKKRTAIDVGCGVGWYSNLLHSLGFAVLGVDARRENVEEARRRYPALRFEVFNAENEALCAFGVFDLVFCFGLLYHLENPFRTVRNLAALASNAVMIESMCYPSREPMLYLMDEPDVHDQAVQGLALYPSEVCLVKMLVRAGVAHCYMPSAMPNTPPYRPNRLGFRQRTILIGAKAPLNSGLITDYPNSSKRPVYPHEMAPVITLTGATGRLHKIIELMFRRRSWHSS